MKLFIKNKDYFDTIPGSNEVHKEAFKELQSESSLIIGVPYELMPCVNGVTHCFVLSRYEAKKDLFIYEYNGGVA